jgi:hypothetical protein
MSSGGRGCCIVYLCRSSAIVRLSNIDIEKEEVPAKVQSVIIFLSYPESKFSDLYQRVSQTKSLLSIPPLSLSPPTKVIVYTKQNDIPSAKRRFHVIQKNPSTPSRRHACAILVSFLSFFSFPVFIFINIPKSSHKIKSEGQRKSRTLGHDGS